MYFDKLIWNSSSPVRKDSTYISLEYVINDLGIFCKGEMRSDDVGFAASRIGEPLGLTPVGDNYAARPFGRVVILWNKITDLSDDSDNCTLTVFGNAHDKIVLKYEPAAKKELLSRIDSMRRFCASSPISDDVAAAWKAWAADTSIPNPFAPLDELIEAERREIDARTYTEAQLDSVVIPEEVPAQKAFEEPVIIEEPAPIPEEAAPAADICPGCGAVKVENARFCNMCGFKF